MTKGEYPRLCGGTFFTLLLEARRQRTKARERFKGEHDGLSNADILVGLIKVMNPNYIEPTQTTKRTFKTNASEFRACKISKGTYLPFEQSCTFDARIKGDYCSALSAMCEFVERYIDAGTNAEKDTRLVKALVQLIINDQTIDNDQPFYACENGATISKDDFKIATDICLQSFLLGIWHFVLLNRTDNTVGKATFDHWCPPQGGAARTYTGNMGNGIAKEFNVYLCCCNKPIPDEPNDQYPDHEPYILNSESDSQRKKESHHEGGTTQTINNPAIFINHGTATQICNYGTVNISGGKVTHEK